MQFFGSAEKPDKPVIQESAASPPESATADNDQTVTANQDAATENAANEKSAATADTTADVNPPAAPEVTSDSGSQTPDETKQTSDQLDTDPPTKSSSPADASTS